MTPDDVRRIVTESAEMVCEASFKQVQGMSAIMQTVMNENRVLQRSLTDEQAAHVRTQMENLNLRIEVADLDNTICDLITPRRVK